MLLLTRYSPSAYATQRKLQNRSLAPCRLGAGQQLPTVPFHRTVPHLNWNGKNTIVVYPRSKANLFGEKHEDIQSEKSVTLTEVISALAKASNAWEKYDKDRNGTMTLKECEEIFNSPEVNEALLLLTNIPGRKFTTQDLEPYFKRADKDRSNTLSRTEFLALYMAVVSDRIKKNPLLLAEALLGFIDKDKNGVLQGGELKSLLVIMGFAPALLLPIPDFVRINYRDILGRLGGELDSSGRRK